eukprot:1160758-Pelagomonas_calceolata.AAC.3
MTEVAKGSKLFSCKSNLMFKHLLPQSTEEVTQGLKLPVFLHILRTSFPELAALKPGFPLTRIKPARCFHDRWTLQRHNVGSENGLRLEL